MNKKIIPVVIVAALAIAAVAYWAFGKRDGADGALIVNGNVDIRQVDLAFQVEGRIAEMSVHEGDRVSTGQELAKLDTGYFSDALDLARARLAAQQAVVAKLESGNRPQEIERARANLEEAEAAVTNAQRTYDRQQELVKTSAASRQARDDARGILDQAVARRAAARQTLDLMLAGAREEDIAQARATMNADAATVALAERRLKDAVLTAPSSGIVLTRIKEPGAVISPGTPVFAMAIDDPIWVRAYVSEVDLGRIHPGQKARVYSDTRPDSPYEGTVGFISPTAEFTPKSVETKELRTSLVYRFRIVIDGVGKGLRQGMPVTVVFEEDGAGR